VLRKTWGESLAGYVGLTVGSWIMLVGSIMFLAGAVGVTVMLHSPVPILLAILVWLVAMFSLAYLVGVASHVYRCALYVYALGGCGCPRPTMPT